MTDVLSKIRLQATGIGGRTPQPSLATDSDIVRGPAITPTASMADSMAVPAKKLTPKARSGDGDMHLKQIYSDSLTYQTRRFQESMPNVCIVGNSMPKVGGSVEPGKDTDRSTTLVKKTDVQKRHGDLWTPFSQPIGSTRNLAIHTDRTMGDDMSVGPFSECNSDNRFTPVSRALPPIAKRKHLGDRSITSAASRNSSQRYMWDVDVIRSGSPKPSLAQTFRDRHLTDASLMEQPRGPKKRGELLLHREPVNLLMGGRSMELSEREDIMSEIQRLKTVMLPTRAKDLYVGRGFKLPAGHALNNPKLKKTSVSSQGKGGAPAKPAVSDAAKAKIKSPADAPPAPPVTREGNGAGEDLGAVGRTPAGTPGPFRGFSVSEVLPQEEIDKLKEMFSKLDSDSTGHLQLSQLEQLKDFTPNQQLFLQQVYELACIGTVFGFNEFASFSEFCKRLQTISEEAKQAYEKANMETIGDSIKQYLELFQSLDQTDTGKVTLASLKGILAMVKEKEFTDEMFAPVKTVVAKEGSDDISKLDYLACIPYFMCLEAG
ncbi:hypothetical protein NP493_226g08043 [Ridgeia piscesae]|uniref:EF-hand domain-containing protein n=1 Tax=Ridgeia piscesae TaxID=27915 RepID=A0AAD9P0B9_RIDPI|nr:hypothetical protein NP493_226g08043 [Ridgeia piscesae]